MFKQIIRHKRKLTSNDVFGASSKRLSYVTEQDGKKYKLRKCFSAEDAEQIIERLKPIGHYQFVPKLVHSEGRWLIFEFYEIPEASRCETKVFWSSLGTAIAALETTASHIADPRFSQPITAIPDLGQFITTASHELRLRGSITQEIHDSVLQAVKIIPDSYCYGYLDILAGNILWDGNQLILADEEGFARTIPGLSLIRPLDIWHQYKPGIGLSRIERNWLLEAYNQKSNSNAQYFINHESQLRTIYYLLKTYDSIVVSGTSSESLMRLNAV